MIPTFFAENLFIWVIQGVLVATAGALLPLVFRIRHPKSQLAYYHAMLIFCFALPLLQPWQESIAIVTGYSSITAPSPSAVLSWTEIAFGAMFLGIFAKLGWLVAGMIQIRRYRRRSTPLAPVSDSIREARRLTGGDARFCLSDDVSGPATLGHIDPVVLLPRSFLDLDVESQRSIACHELLHVQRRDWLITILEEIIGAVMWFNPGVWWLLAQARLAREQLVDAEVVKRTACEPYIEALLSMAVVSRRRWALPAASFFTHGHLVRRMRLLAAGPDRSTLRLSIQYGALAGALALCVSSIALWFPLMGDAQLVLAGPSRPYQVVVHADVPVVGGVRTTKEFNVSVPPPVRPTGDLVYFVQTFDPSNLPPEDRMLVPPPPPPPPGFPGERFLFLEAKGLRMIRPGDVPTAEEIERLKEAFGDRVELTVDRAEDGTVRRISVLARRLSDEAGVIRSMAPFVPADAGHTPDSVR